MQIQKPKKDAPPALNPQSRVRTDPDHDDFGSTELPLREDKAGPYEWPSLDLIALSSAFAADAFGPLEVPSPTTLVEDLASDFDFASTSIQPWTSNGLGVDVSASSQQVHTDQTLHGESPPSPQHNRDDNATLFPSRLIPFATNDLGDEVNILGAAFETTKLHTVSLPSWPVDSRDCGSTSSILYAPGTQLQLYGGPSLSRPSQSSESFSDENFISTPELSLVRAHITILSHIQPHNPHEINIWNAFALSPFNHLNQPQTYPSLPENYRPTTSQKMIEHHPIFDMLPWPSVRNRILHVLSLPISARPDRARDELPNVVMQIKFDMLDAGGGMRVWGSNPFDERNWEVGQTFFKSWWWALNSDIVRNSKALRHCRGVAALRLRRSG